MHRENAEEQLLLKVLSLTMKNYTMRSSGEALARTEGDEVVQLPGFPANHCYFILAPPEVVCGAPRMEEIPGKIFLMATLVDPLAQWPSANGITM